MMTVLQQNNQRRTALPYRPHSSVHEIDNLYLTGLASDRKVGTYAASGWTVTWIQENPGSVRISSGQQGLVVVVGDPGPERRQIGDRGPVGSYRPLDPLSTRVLLAPDGRATVQGAAAPPALLANATQARTIPDVPGCDEQAVISASERLLVLSADALEGLPVSRPRQHRPWIDQVGVREPAEFLAELFRDLDGGSGAIMTFSA
jgi:hypothetical protein